MISRKMKLLTAALAAVSLIATATLARSLHKAAPLDHVQDRSHAQSYDAYPVFGPDGKLIGAAPDPIVRAQMQRDGLPN